MKKKKERKTSLNSMRAHHENLNDGVYNGLKQQILIALIKELPNGGTGLEISLTIEKLNGKRCVNSSLCGSLRDLEAQHVIQIVGQKENAQTNRRAAVWQLVPPKPETRSLFNQSPAE